jgi:hypothetical protein
MAYNVQGTFYEACDCEIICSCWADIDPGMGQCTGLWAWDIEAGSWIDTNTNSVVGCKVLILSNGGSCDEAKYRLTLIEASTQAMADQVEVALNTAPWASVVVDDPTVVAPDTCKKQVIKIITAPGLPSAINVGAGSISVNNARLPVLCTNYQIAANYSFQQTTLSGGDLVSRATGTGTPVTAGKVITTATGDGLNLLADVRDNVDPTKVLYTFDLDITRVTAMTGKFHYTVPPNP